MNYGIAVSDNYEAKASPYKFNTWDGLYHTFNDAVSLQKPTVVVVGRPPRRPQVIAKQSKQIAMLDLVCERRGIPLFEVYDNSCKKLVLGNGVAKKPEIIAWANEKLGRDDMTEHEADALMFTEYVRLGGLKK